MTCLPLKQFRVFLAFALCSLFAAVAIAEQQFEPRLDISDGKGGRPFAKWVQHAQEKPIKKVAFQVWRVSGGDDTFINLRFGDENTVENGKRVYLKNNEKQRVEFNIGGRAPGGKPLVLNAYNGVVKVRWVGVYYQ